MHNVSNKYLLQIHPVTDMASEPVNDELTKKMKRLLKEAEPGHSWRGWHNCTGCGNRSGSKDLIVDKYITNSLATHYLMWHRDDVPESEIQKLRRIKEPEEEISTDERIDAAIRLISDMAAEIADLEELVKYWRAKAEGRDDAE